MKKYIAEALGTFALVLAGCGAIVIDGTTGGVISHSGIALTFGLIVMAMIYALGDVSGAHINPAATVAFWWAGRFEPKHLLPYIAAQSLGALAAAGVLRILFAEHVTLGSTLPAGPWWQSFVLEVLLTWLLMFVVLNVSTGAKEKGIMAGAAIGGTVALEAMFAGPICGASMNPARSLGPALVSGQTQYLWLYLTAPLTGSVLAVFSCCAVQEQGCCRAIPGSKCAGD
ncbi:MAG: MIP/aquaporin family protein [Planctomycetota bacterium]